MGDRAGEGIAYGNLGNDHYCLGNFKQAIEYHKQDLNIVKEVKDRAGEGNANGHLGNAYCSLGDLRLAIEYHIQHLSIAKEVLDRAGEGVAYGNLGIAHEGLGNLKQAIEYYKKSLIIAKEMGDTAGEGRTCGNLGVVHDFLGDFNQAIEYQKRSLSIAKKLGDRLAEGRAYGNLGNIHGSLGDFKQAINYIRRDLTIVKDVGDRAGEGSAYGNLGIAYQRLGDFKQAIEYHKQQLRIAKEVGDRTGEGSAYGNLGNAHYSLGDFNQAIEYHRRHLSTAKEVGDRAGEGRACYSLGRDLQSSASLYEAIYYYRLSVKIFDSIRGLLQSEDRLKISLRDLYRYAYTSLWTTLLEIGETDEALYAAEQGRAQALMDVLKAQYGVAILPSVSVERNTLKETVSRMLTVLSAQTVFLAIYRNTVNFWVLNKGKVVHFTQSEIGHGSANENLVSLLMRNTFNEIGAAVGVRCENRSLDELSDEPLSNRKADEETEKSSTCSNNSLLHLYDVIIGPIAEFLQGEELIIIPDGLLCLAPYSALSKSIRIRTAPSLTALKLITDSPEEYHSKSGALLVGDPCLVEVTNEIGVPILEQLQYAREEVEMIGKLLKTSPLTGRSATKGEVLKRITSVALVHIAAHGRQETGEIALAPNPGWTSKIPKEEDYIMNMSDVQAVLLCLVAVIVVEGRLSLRVWSVWRGLSCVLVLVLFWCHSGRLMTRPPWSS